MASEDIPPGLPETPASPDPIPAQNAANVPHTTPRKRSNPWLVAALLLFIAGTGALIWFETRPKLPEGPPRAYYTTDDGKTLFADDAERLPPFDHGGKQAVRAHVFSCDGGKARFVGYLERLPEEAITTLHAEGQDPQKMDDDDIAGRFGWAAKRPGDKEWVNSIKDAAAYKRVTNVTCPEGHQVVAVSPGQDD